MIFKAAMNPLKAMARQLAGVLIVLLISTPAVADIYSWTDSNGVKHFSNQPPSDAKAVQTKREIKHDSAQYQQWEEQRKESQNSALKRRAKQRAALKQSPQNPGNVVMYSTPTCGYCKRAAAFFSKHNISFTEYDITADKSAMKRFKGLNGRGVPLIMVGEQRIVGFNKPLLKKMFGIQ